MKQANLDNKGGTNSGFIHRVVASLLCCGKMYKTEGFEVFTWFLVFPACDCLINDMYFEGIFTDCNGFADVKYIKVSNKSLTDEDAKEADPKYIDWIIVSSVSRNLKKGGLIRTTLLNEPTLVERGLIKNFNTKTMQWITNLNYNKFFDTCNSIRVRNDVIVIWQNYISQPQLAIENETPIKRRRLRQPTTPLTSYKDFQDCFKNSNYYDVNTWTRLERDLTLFDIIKGKEHEKEKVILEIERINLKSKTDLNRRSRKTFNNSKPKTYYGHKILTYLCDWQDTPDIKYMETNIYEAVASKYSKGNKEVNMWLKYNGDVEKLKTPGLRDTIRRTEFNVCYKMFCERIMRKLPMFIDKTYVYYNCKSPIEICTDNMKPHSSKYHYVCGDTGYLKKHYIVYEEPIKWPSVLLTDAIKTYAAAHDNTFPFVECYNGKKVIHVIKDLHKYSELWRFIDILNVFELNKCTKIFNPLVILNHFITEYGTIEDFHLLTSNYESRDYNRFYGKKQYQKTLLNRYYSMFNIIVDKLIFFKQESPKCANRQKQIFHSLFVDDFNKYLDNFKANHVHVCIRNDLYSYDSTIFRHKNASGELVIWPGNVDVLKSERKRYASKIANWWLEQMYKPNSNYVLKIKKHFQNLVAQRNNV